MHLKLRISHPRTITTVASKVITVLWGITCTYRVVNATLGDIILFQFLQSTGLKLVQHVHAAPKFSSGYMRRGAMFEYQVSSTGVYNISDGASCFSEIRVSGELHV